MYLKTMQEQISNSGINIRTYAVGRRIGVVGRALPAQLPLFFPELRNSKKYQGSRGLIRTQRITGRLLLCLLLLLTSCNSRSVGELLHSEFSQRYAPPGDDTVDELVEIDACRIMERGDPISLVRHHPTLNRLTVVSEQTKIVALFFNQRRRDNCPTDDQYCQSSDTQY